MKFEWLDSVFAVAADEWDALWRSAGAERGLIPFLSHGFLAALEESGCTDRASGWQPRHLIARDAQGALCAAMPLFEKHHSYGEYVFDWSWADAYHRNGIAYYPKLLNAIPFTPATGPRLALSPALDRREAIHHIHTVLQDACQQEGFSGWHSLFLPDDEIPLWQQAGSLTRVGCQFHWHNRGFEHFDQFLESFNSRKRKAVRKERRQVADAGVTLERVVGSDITAADWDRFYHFYQATYLKRSGNSGYLNRVFFQKLAHTTSHQLLMVNARHDGEVIASALCFFDNTHLYGRYWGCLEEIPGLHFEACYYQGIEFAIERGLRVFDPGAQGEHKIQRGFEPTLTYSQHWLADVRFQQAIDDFLRRETPGVMAYRDDCRHYLPFRQEQ